MTDSSTPPGLPARRPPPAGPTTTTLVPTDAVRFAAAGARFPDGFVWGAATSSFQIEGARASRAESIWDRFCTQPGAILDASNGDVACGHVERIAEDVDLMSTMGLRAYRFSVSWPRVLPDGGRGQPAAAGLDVYDRLVDHLLGAGIEPYVTLYHWDLPQALEDRGGWPERATAYRFAEYADIVVSHLGDRVKHWATLNEPYCSSYFGYGSGFMAPGRSDVGAQFAAAHHLLLGHGLAMERIRERAPGAEAGIVLNFAPMYPASDDPADGAAAAAEHALFNRWFVEPIAGAGYPIDATADRWSGAELLDGDLDIIATPVDVLGVNYYCRMLIAADRQPVAPRLPVTGMGWEIYPAGLSEIMTWLHEEFGFARYLVTENGAAMDDQPDEHGFVNDQDRIEYLRAHLDEVRRLVGAGLPIDGYFAWSLLDNFEWAFGYTKRFGLIRTDYDTLERIPKASAGWYGCVAAANAVAEPTT